MIRNRKLLGIGELILGILLILLGIFTFIRPTAAMTGAAVLDLSPLRGTRLLNLDSEEEGVFLAYASIHGNTAKGALALKEMLERRGVKVCAADVCRTDVAQCVANAFRYSKMICCAASYDGGLFLPMEDFLHHLKAKTYQNRKVALVENGTWAPSAARVMKEILGSMKNVEICDKTVTICSAVKEDTLRQLEELADAVAAM